MPPADESNPFSTRWTRPGAVDFHFPQGEGAELLVDRLAANQWRGQIVGPHGTGKSTLLRQLLPHLEQRGRSVVLVTLSQHQRSWYPTTEQRQQCRANTQIVVDGYEQLSVWARWRLRLLVSRRKAGLLVTAHQNVGLPQLAQTGVTLPLAQQIVAELQAGGPELVKPGDVGEALAARQGNLREALFDLYDLYELRRPRSK